MTWIPTAQALSPLMQAWQTQRASVVERVLLPCLIDILSKTVNKISEVVSGHGPTIIAVLGVRLCVLRTITEYTRH